MGEQRYKVGDWVRVKDNRGAPRDYKAGDVCQVTKIEDDIVRCGEAGMFDYRFEPWQPRVGERVRYRNATYGEAIVKETLPDGRFVVDTEGRYGTCTERLKSLEPILTTTPEQPAALKIEEGKFYKTRDGRKVGPMDEWVSGQFREKIGDGRFWLSGGKGRCAATEEDLIAEWIDEPVARASTTTASNDNAQPKFKVGDRVRVVKEGFTKSGSGHNAKIGDEFVLREMNPSKAFWRTNGPDFYEHEIELVVFASIVALIENGQPKPSSTPHVHTSTEVAEKEAKRLAAKHKGKQFGVFTLTTTHEEAAPVYDHKWQNLAALGLKIDAIKELRSITGMGLKPAKDAVEYFLDAA